MTFLSHLLAASVIGLSFFGAAGLLGFTGFGMALHGVVMSGQSKIEKNARATIAALG